MSVFSNLLAGGLTAAKQVAGVSLRITRGASVETTTGLPGRVDPDRLETNSPQARYVDWLIGRADYLVSGSAAEPNRDDKIEELDASGNVVRTFKVAPLPGINEAWKHSDTTRLFYRVHCVEVKTP